MKISTEDYVLGGVAAFLLLFVIGIFGGGSAGTKTPDQMAEKLVAALQTKEIAEVEKLLITPKDIIALINSSDADEDEKKNAIAEIESGEENPSKALEERWERIYGQMQEQGLDYATLKVEEVAFEEEVRSGIRGAEVEVHVSSKVNPGVIHFTVLQRGNWHLLPEISVTLGYPH